MHVLVLHSRYRSGSLSGENRTVDDEVRLLREAGHEVHLWSPSPERLGGAELVRTGLRAVWSRRSASHVAELIRRHRPDVVHCHNLFPLLSPAVVRAATKAPALVATLHNYRLLCLPATFVRNGEICEACLGRLAWRGVVHRCYRHSAPGSAALATSLGAHRALGTFDRVSLFLAVSAFVRDKHIQAGFAPERIHVKPNFAWETPRRRGAGDYYLFLGRLSAEKGVDRLLDAWRASPRLGQLLIVGDGPERVRLSRRAPAGVEFRGAVSVEQVPPILARARALVVPSVTYEGAPRSVVEAYAAGVPVIANAAGALPELVEDGVTGLLVQSAHAGAWGAAFDKLAAEDFAHRLGEGAQRIWRERYSPKRGLAELEDAYARALKRAAARDRNEIGLSTGARASRRE
jgi:glycosyltransferase involved in cell wall biosynthesis